MGCEKKHDEPGRRVGNGMVEATHCGRCGAVSHPPRDFCPECMSTTVTRVEVNGRGTIYSFAEVHLGMSEPFRARAPYNIALVETESGLRVLTNIVGEGKDELEIGQSVEPIHEKDESGRTLLLFRRLEI